ncbi:coiled-coil domain-containing protein 60-like [Salminus brasiliensis]|uniref:coiled-coil domain-containing protein 60-like n=1 Tax=Salminus brasiliensis TaxID=930266 RepID=UPI003B839B72
MPTPPTAAAARRYIRSASVRDCVLQHKESWERVYWESLGRSQRDQSRLGYRTDEAPKVEISEDDDDGRCHASPVGTSQGNKNRSQKCPKTQRRTDSDSFRKRLCQSRKLVLAVKQGRSYFHLLQEQEAQEEQQRERRRREERRQRAIRPPSVSSDSDTDREAERRGVNAAISSSWKLTRRRRVQSGRPFTPVHRSLTSHQIQELPHEHMYRQLCCLCWLLESLTLEHAGRVGPMTSCWDTKDPGRSRNTLKTLNKEKAIQAKWEQFVSPPKVFLFPSSALSPARDVIVPGEEDEPPSTTGSETEPPVSEYLQKLLEEVHKSVAKDLYGSEREHSSEPDRGEILRRISSRLDSAITGKVDMQRPKSSPARRPPATTAFSHRKAAMLEEIRLSFEDRAEELALGLTDALDRSAKRRWSGAVQRYRFLANASSYGSLASSACSGTFPPSPQQSEHPDTVTERPYSTQWLSVLLRGLAAHTHLDRKLVCVLEKLRRFTAQQTLRIRPHIFLRVLNSLQPWELCCPDLCVAIEMVRQSAVGMSEEEYDRWLCGRVNLPQTKHYLRVKPTG